MEPIPETVEAIDEYGPFGADGVDLVALLRERARRVEEVVPDCLGFSLALQEHGVTFALVADGADVAVLDAVQHLTGGAGAAAVGEPDPTGLDLGDVLDEDSWRRSGRASAARGVQSTLMLPIVEDQRVVGSVSLYGASGRAFTGHHRELASVFGAWAPGAVTNADLSLATLREARLAPQLLKDEVTVHVAVGILVARDGLDVQVAERSLRDASARAGVSVLELAKAVLEASRYQDDQ
jgi:ANTAR domain-containing protein